jgi:hypothetical protein
MNDQRDNGRRPQGQYRERGFSGQEPDSGQTAIARIDRTELVKHTGTVRDEGALTGIGGWLAANTNLLTPVAGAAIPAGFALQVTAVEVTSPEESYPVKGGEGKRGLGKAILNRLAQAAGIEWVTDKCVRLDDGSDPHYCYFQVVAVRRGLDNRIQPLMATKEMDLRDGSPLATEIISSGKTTQSGQATLAGQRAHIVSHAETKAKLRLIREATGLRHSYSGAELARPFVAARLVFTGDFGDPQINGEVAKMVAAQALGLTDALYGRRTGAAAAERLLPSEAAHAAGALPAPTSALHAAAGDAVNAGAAGRLPPPPPGVSREVDNGHAVLDLPADDAGDDLPDPDEDREITPEAFARLNVDAQVELLVQLARAAGHELAADRIGRNSPQWRLDVFNRLSAP